MRSELDYNMKVLNLPMITGKIDCIANKDGDLIIIDNKTSK